MTAYSSIRCDECTEQFESDNWEEEAPNGWIHVQKKDIFDKWQEYDFCSSYCLLEFFNRED